MSDLVEINLGIDSTGKGGDSQRTAFEKCNDNFNQIRGTINFINQNSPNYAHNGENTDITSLKGLKQNIVQPADASDDMGSVTLRQLNAKFALGSGNVGGVTRTVSDFIGALQWFNGSRATIPVGYISADGQLLNRLDYPELWEKLSSNMLNCVSDEDWLNGNNKRASFSYGDGLTTFRMPDINGKQAGSLKGLFIRGDGYAASGTVLSDTIRNITGGFATVVPSQHASYVRGAFSGSAGANVSTRDSADYPYQSGLSTDKSVYGFALDASKVVPTDNENRPVSANLIAIIRVSGIMWVDTHQEVVSASTTPPKPKELISGGMIESSFTIGSSKYATASFSSVKTAGKDGVGIQFNTTDFSTEKPISRQYTLNSESGEIFTYSSQENGRGKLGLGSAATYNVGNTGNSLPVLSASNTWSQSQTIQVNSLGMDGLVLNSNAYLSNPVPSAGTILRAPAVVSKASNLGSGFYAKFFCEERYYDTTRAVIELMGWNGNFHWWTFSANGNAFADGAWINSSDERLKENFKTIDDGGDILSKACSFRGYTFSRIKTGEVCAGFKAQDIQKVLPEAVSNIGDTRQEDGILENTLGLDYGAMSAFNHECILALIKRLEVAEKTIAKLQESLNGKV